MDSMSTRPMLNRTSRATASPNFLDTAARFTNNQLVRAEGASLISASNAIMSIGCWVKVNDASQALNSHDWLFGVANPASASQMYRLAAYHDGDGSYNLRLTHANSTFTHYDDTTDLFVGDWHRVWMVVAGQASRKVYIDGVKTLSSTQARSQPSCVDFGIAGTVDSTPAYSQDITLFDVQYYDAALSDADVLYDYNNLDKLAHTRSGSSAGESDLILHWQCNDGSGATFEDLASNNNNGTATGVNWDDTQNVATAIRS